MGKHWQYAGYVMRHKWFVFLACLTLSATAADVRWHTRLALIGRGVIHDWTKLLPCEWVPYAWYFNGKDDIRYHKLHIKGRFQRAWLHHQHANKHHWQHWILRNDDGSIHYLEMPALYVLEMVADWRGAGRAAGKPDTPAWYLRNGQQILLGHATKRRVKDLLGLAWT